MKGEWICHNKDQLEERVQFFMEWLLQQDQWPVKWVATRYRATRSMSQNALFHVWVGQFACHLLNKDKATPKDMEDMKNTLQGHCYQQTSWEWLIEIPLDLFTGAEKPPKRRSTTKLDKGEMHMYMNWVQAQAADRGLILESTGEYAELLGGSMR